MMLKLAPRIGEYAADFLGDAELVGGLVSGFGSPLNIVFPAQAGRNLAAFRGIYAKRGISGKVFYAHKVNRSASLAREAAARGACMDVASRAELESALAAGFPGERIEATGPKNEGFILLGLQHGIIFNVDNMGELSDIISLRRKHCVGMAETRVLLRASDFPGIARKSRFGTSFSMFGEIIGAAKSAAGHIDIIGVSFHLDSVELREKVAAISGALRLFEPLRAAGFAPRVLDIGGGFKVSYARSKSEWQDAVSRIKESIISGGRLTWNGYKYGMSAADGAIRGSPNVYSYYNDLAGAEYLDAILSAELEEFEGRTVADFLCDNMIELYIEPGRAFLDQAGISLARVNFVRRLESGGHLVGLDAKSGDLVEQDGFVDPIVIGDGGGAAVDDEGCYIAGSLCAEADMISRRRFFLGRVPRKGDILAFVNTAGYFMDFYATAAAMKYPAPKTAAYKSGGKWRWATDGNYLPRGDG
ncbi:MAG: hypothetical protein LBT92_02645 [Rickettsiales bacterium]|jgi:diaminopimelate decarboxylase|nr:hypothetical protein [Rickettsiales bacterium]